MINLYADVDVSVICEEVVEGVFAGHLFQSGTAANFDSMQFLIHSILDRVGGLFSPVLFS